MSETEIKRWLEMILKKIGVKYFSISNLGNSGKGEGYFGDIVFVNVAATTEDGTTQEYKLVLKCSKKSQTLREISKLKYVCLNEIFIYNEVFPAFIKFQEEKGVKDPFDNVPKSYGTFIGENMEVIVLENLKEIGYSLWPCKNPLTKEHVDLVIRGHAKFHAISIAMSLKEKEKFEKIVRTLEDYVNFFSLSNSGLIDVMRSCIYEVHDLFLNEFDSSVMAKWRKFGDNLDSFYEKCVNNPGVKVVVHGDSWNNNFMFKYNHNGKIPTKVLMLDWQMSKYVSPVWDLGYFLFCCLSEENFECVEDILIDYHNSFVEHLKNLGVENPNPIYPLDHLMKDWKEYGKSGVMLATLLMKICSTEEDELVDLEKSVEEGKTFGDSFIYEIRNKEYYKKRMRPIMKYLVRNGFLDD